MEAYLSFKNSPDKFLRLKDSPKKIKIEKFDLEKDAYQRFNVSPKKDRLEKAHFDLKN